MSSRVPLPTACLAGALITLVVLLAGLQPAPAGATVVRQHGRMFGFDGYRGSSAGRARFSVRAAADGGQFGYQGGPVLHSSAPYLIFWDPTGAIPPASRALAVRYFSDVARDSGRGTNRYAVDRQYTDATGFADYRQTFDPSAQALVDTQPYPSPSGCDILAPALTTCLSDGDVASELDRLIAQKNLPSGLGAGAPIYFVFLPPEVNECSSDSTCATDTYCAYHTYTTTASGQTALYAVIPSVSLSAGENVKDCQWDGGSAVQEPNHDPMDALLTSVSHEDTEAITDPLLNAWIDPATGNETSDMCAQQGVPNPLADTNPDAFQPTQGGSAALGTLFNQTIAGDHFYLQSEWSNGVGGCAPAPAPESLAPAFRVSVTGSALTLTLDSSPTNSTGGYSSVTWNFGDGSAPAFQRTAAAATVTHAFPHTGSYAVTLTVVDGEGNLATATHQVVLGAAPHAVVKVAARPAAHTAVAFSAGASAAESSGASLVAYRWSFGDGSSATGASPTHVYARPGAYTVTLQVTDSLGQSAEANHNLTISPAGVSAKAASAGRSATAAAARAGRPRKHVARHRMARKAHRAKAHRTHGRRPKAHRAKKRKAPGRKAARHPRRRRSAPRRPA